MLVWDLLGVSLKGKGVMAFGVLVAFGCTVVMLATFVVP
jgi:hypothetical protein